MKFDFKDIYSGEKLRVPSIEVLKAYYVPEKPIVYYDDAEDHDYMFFSKNKFKVLSAGQVCDIHEEPNEGLVFFDNRAYNELLSFEKKFKIDYLKNL